MLELRERSLNHRYLGAQHKYLDVAVLQLWFASQVQDIQRLLFYHQHRARLLLLLP